jgi:tetratricopeptide (TPR) repeat protein
VHFSGNLHQWESQLQADDSHKIEILNAAVAQGTPCTTLDQLEPEVRSNTEDAFTLYRDQIRFKNYADALPLWKVAYYNAPGANGQVTYHFDDGIKIYDHFYKNESDEERKAALVDTIMMIYDKRIDCFGDDGTITARKAFNSYYYYRNYVDEDQIFDMFRKVIEMKGNNADYFMINPFTKLLYDKVLAEEVEIDIARDLTYQIFDAINYGLETCEGQYCEAWDIINEYSPNLLGGLEGIRGYYDCEYYMDKYYEQFLMDSTDCDNVTEVYLKMRWAACDSADARMVLLRTSKDKQCYIPPPPPGPLKLAYSALNDGFFQEAIDHFNTFIEQTDDPENKAEKLLLISKIYYAHIKNFAAARQYALRAAEHKPNWGEPFMLIGKLYASSGPLCGPGRGWDSQIVTWPAIDKFEYAKRIDPNVTKEANEWIKKYEIYMPSVEDIFQRQMEKGQKFRVGCWIQENTMIRPAPKQT